MAFHFFKISLLFMSILTTISLNNCFAEESSKTNPVITYVEGTVEIKQATDSDFSDATIGTSLGESSIIKTGDNSLCDIALDAKGLNIISISANTEIILKDHRDFMRKVQIQSGRVFTRLDALPAGSSFEVQASDIAIAGARGTAWETIVGDSAQFNGFEGTFYTRPFSSTTENDIGKGKAIEIKKDGSFLTSTVSSKDLERLNNLADRIDVSIRQFQIDYFNGDASQLFEETLEDQILTQNLPETFASGPEGLDPALGQIDDPSIGADFDETIVNGPGADSLTEGPSGNDLPSSDIRVHVSGSGGVSKTSAPTKAGISIP